MIGSTRYTASVEIQRQTSLAAEISKLQQSVSSNKRLTAASDDPKAAARIADIRQNQADNTVWKRNADIGAGIAASADTALKSLSSLTQRAKELIIAGANDTNANLNRTQIAAELRSIAGEITALSQSKDPNGQPLFPTGDPLQIPVSNGRSLPATASATEVFGTVKTAQGDRSMVDILNNAAAALELGPDAKLPYTDADGNTTDADGNPLEWTQTEALAASVAAIGNADDHVLSVQTDQGIRAQRFDTEKASLSSGGDDMTVERSSLEDTDLTYAVAAYQAKSLSLQAAQTMFAQTHKNSLFDLIG
ncbi:flagellin-like protein [Sphingomonas sp.]|uniref:flagellin N-terminal helical domain-containing protein n=1 Tax=Sphingomonas sp. TaxID=28214 RepID=UPI000DB23A5E|nr:flagellin-like protein [Sphingomonas sp.]PZU11548.1 MAG: flagellin-like protein [Sphingomonas sp.]